MKDALSFIKNIFKKEIKENSIELQKLERINEHSKLIESLLLNPRFKQLVSQRISDIGHAYRIRPTPKPGFYYKRIWIDRMIEANTLNSDYFIRHIKDVLTKQSKLSAETRVAISSVCNEAIDLLIREYATLFELNTKK